MNWLGTGMNFAAGFEKRRERFLFLYKRENKIGRRYQVGVDEAAKKVKKPVLSKADACLTAIKSKHGGRTKSTRSPLKFSRVYTHSILLPVLDDATSRNDQLFNWGCCFVRFSLHLPLFADPATGNGKTKKRKKKGKGDPWRGGRGTTTTLSRRAAPRRSILSR